jgi:aspartate 4-decarboxylase
MPAIDRQLERLDPFELKDKLIALARASAKRRGSGDILNAGRGNPDWQAIEPREAFFELGRFAMLEARRTPPAEGLGGAPKKRGIARRLRAFLARQTPTAGTRFLGRALRFATGPLRCEADALVHEWVDGACGDHYPEPVRMLPHAERAMRCFLEQELCKGSARAGRLDLFAVEGASAGVCYLFDARSPAAAAPRQPDRGGGADFFPYLEIRGWTGIAGSGIKPRDRKDGTQRGGDGTWQYPDAKSQMADPS